MTDERHRTIADLLRAERERRNQSVEELATALRISPEKLQRIESGDSSDFPSELYFSLFCKSYAEILGIDYVRTMDAMAASAESAAGTADASKPDARHSFTMPPPPIDGPPPTRKILFGVFIALAIVALLFLVWRALADPESSEFESVTEAPVDTLSLEPVEFRMQAKVPTFAVIAVGQDTVLAKKLETGEQYAYTGRQALQISVANGSAVRTFVNDWEVDLVDYQTGMISARTIRPDQLLPLLRDRSPEVADTLQTAVPTSNGNVSTSAGQKLPTADPPAKSGSVTPATGNR